MVGIKARWLTLCAVTLVAGSSCMVGARAGGRDVGIEFLVKEPPRERAEVAPPAPNGEYVWIKGYWRRSADDYEWTSGRWERPPVGFHEWVAGHWDHESRGWFFVDGHWS